MICKIWATDHEKSAWYVQVLDMWQARQAGDFIFGEGNYMKVEWKQPVPEDMNIWGWDGKRIAPIGKGQPSRFHEPEFNVGDEVYYKYGGIIYSTTINSITWNGRKWKTYVDGLWHPLSECYRTREEAI